MIILLPQLQLLLNEQPAPAEVVMALSDHGRRSHRLSDCPANVQLAEYASTQPKQTNKQTSLDLFLSGVK